MSRISRREAVASLASAAGALALAACRGPRATPADASGESTVPLLVPLVALRGRFDLRDPAGPRFAWPGSAVVARFSGSAIDATLRDAGTNFFSVRVDDGPTTRLATSPASERYAIARGLAPGEHTVTLTKRTEANVGVVQLRGLHVDDGALLPPLAPPSRRIEYVGDSITCGYGNLGGSAACDFTPETEDETVAYGALAASELGAARTVVAYSGRGVLLNYGGSVAAPRMAELFERALADDPTSAWAFTEPPPDVVVVNLGTNDFSVGDPGPGFTPAYAALLRRIRRAYPAAHVLAALSPMLTNAHPPGVMARAKAAAAIDAAVGELRGGGDARVSTMAFDEQHPSDGYGCNFHPSARTHRIMAGALVEAIRSVTGWSG